MALPTLCFCVCTGCHLIKPIEAGFEGVIFLPFQSQEYHLKRIEEKTWIQIGDVDEQIWRMEKALDCINKAIECSSNYASTLNIYIWESKGSILFFLEKYKEAVKSYDKALEIEPNYYGSELSNKGMALEGLGKDEDARKFFDHLEYMEEKYGAIIKFDGTLLDDIVNPWW